MHRSNLLVVALALIWLATGCDREAAQRRQKQQARECVDKFCPGDMEPDRNMATEVAIKLNGQWFIGPKAYGNPNSGAMSFYWPSKAPSGDPSAVSQAVEVERNAVGSVDNFYDVAIETFLTGRQRWPDPTVLTPWESSGWEERFEELQRQGLRMEREHLRSDLERVRFLDTEGQQYRHEYFLATQQRKVRGNGVPGVACDLYPNSRAGALPRCTGGMYWTDDVYADWRFHAKHAADWPAIHQEVARVLNLVKKVQP